MPLDGGMDGPHTGQERTSPNESGADSAKPDDLATPVDAAETAPPPEEEKPKNTVKPVSYFQLYR